MVIEETKPKTYPSTENTGVLSVRVPKELVENVDSQAKTLGKKRSEYLTEIIEDALKEDASV